MLVLKNNVGKAMETHVLSGKNPTSVVDLANRSSWMHPTISPAATESTSTCLRRSSGCNLLGVHADGSNVYNCKHVTDTSAQAAFKPGKPTGNGRF